MYRKNYNDKNYITAEEYFLKGDKVKALEYYQKAAESGIVPAMTACGEIEIEQNVENALKWFNRAAEFNDVTAMVKLAEIYQNHFKKRNLAQKWLDKAETLTDLNSVKELAFYYAETGAIKNHTAKAIELYKKAVDMGDKDSLNELGDLYLSIEKYGAAEHYYLEGAKAGDVRAMLNFGTMMTYLPGNFNAAKFWLTTALQHGNIYAFKLLGDLYKEYQNYPKALRWYRKAYKYGEDTQQEIREIKQLFKVSKIDYKLKLRSFD